MTNVSHEEYRWKNRVEKEMRGQKNWNKTWGWMLDEYKIVQEQLYALSQLVPIYKRVDPRSIKDIPESVNHEYGWLCIRPEFSLQTMGPDLHKVNPLPRKFRVPYVYSLREHLA